MLHLLEHLPLLGPYVIKPVLAVESFTVDGVLFAVNGVRVLLGL
jgi:hypothetical protein